MRYLVAVVALGCGTAWAAPGDAPLGSKIGIEVDGLRSGFPQLVRGGAVDAGGPGLLDYTFGSAPCDWEPRAGEWEVVSRFACDPTWSFFGGRSRGLAAIWHKRAFPGDVLFEIYVCFRHGLTTSPAEWSYRPADLCLTLAGDGLDPSSGYSFIFGADQGARTVIRRGTEELASTTAREFVPPSYLDERPNAEAFHRRWWRLEARREGHRLSFWVDGKLALEATDSDPLPGGHVAVWTVSNGLCLARARICHGGDLMPVRPAVRLAAPAPLPTGAVARTGAP